MSHSQYLRDLLRPLGIYDLEAPFNGGELDAQGEALDRAMAALEEIQRDMLSILNQAGYHALPPLPELKRQAEGYAPLRVTVADGWLIAAEAVGWARLGYRKILCVQPFACLPGHIFGKGQYAALQRKLPGARLVSVDYDASTGEGTVLSRIRMLLDEELDPELL